MIYIVEGSESIFVRKKINEFLHISDAEICKFDGNNKDFSIIAMIEACNASSLFANKNVILVKDPAFLIKKISEDDSKELLDYINNPVFETELVFYTLDNKFNSKLKIYKSIEKNAEIIKCNTLDYRNFDTFVNQEIRKAKLDITPDAVFELNQICKRSASVLFSNIQVLINYPGKIDSDVIKKLCTGNQDNDSFELINAITDKDISKVIDLEHKMINDSNSIYSIIGLLAAQLRFLYRLSYLLSKNKKKSEILEEMNISDYRYNKSVSVLRKLNMNQILKLLNNLSQLDIQCKSDNSISDQLHFEMFILHLEAI